MIELAEIPLDLGPCDVCGSPAYDVVNAAALCFECRARREGVERLLVARERAREINESIANLRSR